MLGQGSAPVESRRILRPLGHRHDEARRAVHHGGSACHVAGLALRDGAAGAPRHRRRPCHGRVQCHHRRGTLRQGPGGAVGVRLRRLRRTHAHHAAGARGRDLRAGGGGHLRLRPPLRRGQAGVHRLGPGVRPAVHGHAGRHVRHGHDLHVRQHGRSGRQHVRGGASGVFGQVARGHAAVPASRAVCGAHRQGGIPPVQPPHVLVVARRVGGAPGSRRSR